jgi:hypothetical protein
MEKEIHMQKTYKGGCHCGAVRFEADIDLAAGTFRCNCSICARGRAWLAGIPASQFRFVAGEATLSDYQFGAHRIHHLFCPACGIKVLGRVPGAKGEEGNVAVSVACLDASPEELATAPIQYFDGLHDDFKKPPALTQYL